MEVRFTNCKNGNSALNRSAGFRFVGPIVCCCNAWLAGLCVSLDTWLITDSLHTWPLNDNLHNRVNVT
jgi:hypothetical protein